MPLYDNAGTERLQYRSTRRRRAAFVIMLAAGFAACERQAEAVDEAAPTVVEAGNCDEGGFLKAELYGSIERRLDWSADDMLCESMLRPDGEGVRLRFTGAAAERRLAIILALPGLERGVTGSEYATVATLTVEGSGRFFSTPNTDTCWTDITEQAFIADDRYDVTGKLYCVAPLGEINGDAAVEIPELTFRGTVAWESK